MVGDCVQHNMLKSLAKALQPRRTAAAMLSAPTKSRTSCVCSRHDFESPEQEEHSAIVPACTLFRTSGVLPSSWHVGNSWHKDCTLQPCEYIYPRRMLESSG